MNGMMDEMVNGMMDGRHDNTVMNETTIDGTSTMLPDENEEEVPMEDDDHLMFLDDDGSSDDDRREEEEEEQIRRRADEETAELVAIQQLEPPKMTEFWMNYDKNIKNGYSSFFVDPFILYPFPSKFDLPVCDVSGTCFSSSRPPLQIVVYAQVMLRIALHSIEIVPFTLVNRFSIFCSLPRPNSR